MAKKTNPKTVTALKHDEATRKNIRTAEYQSVLQKEEQSPVRVAYERRNRDLDPRPARLERGAEQFPLWRARTQGRGALVAVTLRAGEFR